jgi:hypothetical protein
MSGDGFEAWMRGALTDLHAGLPADKLREQTAAHDAYYRSRQRANLTSDAIEQATADYINHRNPPGRCPCGVDGCVLRRDAAKLLTAAGVNPDLWRDAGQEPRQSP